MPFTMNNLVAAVAAFALTASAAPTLTKRITPNTQSCTCTDHGVDLGSYSVTIGIPYHGGGGCNNVFDALNNQGPYAIAPTNWQCKDDGNGGTQLWFNAQLDLGGEINSALESMYPTIAGGFHCPDY